MITAIEIENFKGIGPRRRIELAPLTLLVGPNSAGKSTVLHALHYAREVLERHNLNADRTIHGGTCVDLGGFANFVHGRDEAKSIVLRFDLDLRETGLPWVLDEDFNLPEASLDVGHLNSTVKTAWVEFAVRYSPLRGRHFVESYATGINGHRFATLRSDFDARSVRLTELVLDHPHLRTADGADSSAETAAPLLEEYLDAFHITGAEKVLSGDGHSAHGSFPLEQSSDALPNLFGVLNFPTHAAPEQPFGPIDLETFRAVLTQLIVAPGRALLEKLRSFRYVGPLRDSPARNYEPPRFPDESRWATGLAAWDMLYENDELRTTVSEWLSDPNRLDTGYRLELRRLRELSDSDELGASLITGRVIDADEEVLSRFRSLRVIPRIILLDSEANIELRPQDVGVGISQLLPVVVAALDGAAQLTAIEQPELHIHPTLQANLGDVLVYGVVAFPSRQFLIETHSIHLVLRLQRRIRETKRGSAPRDLSLSGDKLRIVYAMKTNGETSFLGVELDDTGELLQPWPDAFLEQDYRERFA